MKIKIKQIVIFLKEIVMDKEIIKFAEEHIINLNALINLFKGYLDVTGDHDEPQILQKYMKEEISKLIKLLEIDVCENNFLV